MLKLEGSMEDTITALITKTHYQVYDQSRTIYNIISSYLAFMFTECSGSVMLAVFGPRSNLFWGSSICI